MDKRQSELLKEIVEVYIRSAKPIGSKSLCNKFNCSSATIRNEMAVLESLGFIEKNHLSSGRTPSEKGYKYYVDYLMKPKELNGDEMLKLQRVFQNSSLKISDAITQCVEIISEITNYTSVVLGKNSKDNTLKQVSIIPINSDSIVALVCTDHGVVENKQFYLGEDFDVQEIVKTCEIINKMLVGTPIDEVSERLEFEIKPIIAKKMRQYETVYNIFYDAFNDFTKSNVVFSGKTNILMQPEYNNVDDVKNIISKFEDENLIKKIEEKDEGVNVYIGDETEFDPNVTIIKTSYKINGEEGTIAIVGPKRMQYDKVVGLLEYINEKLGGENERH